MITTPSPSVRSRSIDAEQRVDLLRGERAGGLVEDDDPGVQHEHPQDLDQLALGDSDRSRTTASGSTARP